MGGLHSNGRTHCHNKTAGQYAKILRALSAWHPNFSIWEILNAVNESMSYRGESVGDISNA